MAAAQELHPIFAAALAPFMPAKARVTDADLERLNDALQAMLRLGAFQDEAALMRAHIRASNVLLDACIDAGMSHDEADHEAWAAKRVARWLVEG